MNLLWSILFLIGIVFGILSGDTQTINDALLDGPKEAVTLCISMLGIMAFWTGLMEIAKQAGLLSTLTHKLRPFLRLLFPNLPATHIANEYIASNIIANLVGLGWAATPMGLKAMKALAELETERNNGTPSSIASPEMCTFLILNISSLQLIPINVIAYRSQYGSTNPSAILFSAILSTFFSTLAGIIFSILAQKISYGNKH